MFKRKMFVKGLQAQIQMRPHETLRKYRAQIVNFLTTYAHPEWVEPEIVIKLAQIILPTPAYTDPESVDRNRVERLRASHLSENSMRWFERFCEKLFTDYLQVVFLTMACVVPR